MDNEKKSIWKKIYNFMGKFVDFSSASLCGIMFLLIAYQVVVRLIIRKSDPRTDEITGYLFIWVVYFGMILAAKDKEHINVTIVTELFRPRTQIVANLLARFIWAYYNAYVSIASIQLVKGMIAGGGRTPILKIGLGYLYLIMPIAFIWTMVYVVRDIVEYLKMLKKKDVN